MIESFGTIALQAYLDRDAIAFLFLIAVLIVRPQGLMGAKLTLYTYSLMSIVGINIMLAVSLNLITGPGRTVQPRACGLLRRRRLWRGAERDGRVAAADCARSRASRSPGGSASSSASPSVRLRSDFLAVTTIGVGFLFIGFVRKQSWLGAEMGISRIPPSGLGPIGNSELILVCASPTIAFSLYLDRSWMGFAFRAVADDEQAARTLAISVSTYKLAAFAIGTAIAGLAGGLYAYFTQFIVPDFFGFILSVTLMAMVVIGGAGSTWGVVAATIVLTLLPEAFRFISDYRLLVFGGLLVLVMRFAPGGLAGIVASAAQRFRPS